ncbi:hypothetical protein BDV96DRAFT_603343 [Lophiotrema nucula]|uniref:Uncharacterized protein n=1 Tax=Lophiotrema nucula TaxID=690887 RepID=A0A6A5YVI5_9PLEO|nr:hypothetical protein BDV96DRAFT_603343 [Lophiotrema nucula]
MRFLHYLTACGSIVMGRYIPQAPLEGCSVVQEKVPGHNPAYYTRTLAAHQLFDIDEFTLYPEPPISYRDGRVFFYLRGTIYDEPSELANATLTLRAQMADEPPNPDWEFTNKIRDFKVVTVRHDGIYGGPLTTWGNELVGVQDLFHFGHDPETTEVTIEAVARLPDERILFAFAAKFNMTL